MKERKSSRSSLFLIELIISIFFFTIASAVCIQLFAKSFLLSQNTRDLNSAVNYAASTAEVLDSCMGDMNEVQKIFPQSLLDESVLYFYYDTKWKICSKADARFMLTLTISNDVHQKTGQIEVFKDTDNPVLIYQLDTRVIVPHRI